RLQSGESMEQLASSISRSRVRQSRRFSMCLKSDSLLLSIPRGRWMIGRITVNDRLAGSSWTNPIRYRDFIIVIGDPEYRIGFEAFKIGDSKAHMESDTLPRIKKAIDDYWTRKIIRNAKRGIMIEAPEK